MIATELSLPATAAAVETRGTVTAQAVPSGTRAVEPDARAVGPRAKVAESGTSEPSEAQALQLVRDELPALQQVIDRLRADSPTQYKKAVREIGRSAKRLETVRLRDEQLYQLDLELMRSRMTISLLVARLKVRDDESDRQSLQAMVAQLHQAELARAQYEVEVLQKRLKKTTDQLAQAQSRLEKKTGAAEEYERDVYADYLRRAGRVAEISPATKHVREKGKSE